MEDTSVLLPTYYDDILRYFDYAHLSPKLQDVSRPFCHLAYDVAYNHVMEPNPQTALCLQKLLEAKDCAVRAALDNL